MYHMFVNVLNKSPENKQEYTQQLLASWKSTIETVEKGEEYVQT